MSAQSNGPTAPVRSTRHQTDGAHTKQIQTKIKSKKSQSFYFIQGPLFPVNWMNIWTYLVQRGSGRGQRPFGLCLNVHPICHKEWSLKSVAYSKAKKNKKEKKEKFGRNVIFTLKSAMYTILAVCCMQRQLRSRKEVFDKFVVLMP